MFLILKRYSVMIMIKILCFIGALICVLKSSSMPQYSFWILPVCYTTLLFICKTNCKMTKSNPGALILNITMAIRYVLLPLIIYSTGELSRFADNYNHIDTAISLMLYEMMVLMIVLEVSARVYYRKQLCYFKKITRKDEEIYFRLNNGWILCFIVIIAILWIAVVYKDLAAGFRVIISGSLEQNTTAIQNNIIDIVWQMLCVWLYMYVIINQVRAYKRDSKKYHAQIVILYTFIFILVTFIESVAFSRWYTIISAAASFSCICKLLPNFKKKFIISILVPACLLIILITTYKNAGYGVGNTSFLDSLGDIFSSSNFDSYFAGPVNVNNAIGVKENVEGLDVFTIFRDMLNNMPIINHYMDITKTTVYAYNKYIGRLYGLTGDQIIPLIGQSIIYFGYLFAPLLSVICVLIIRKFDYMFNVCKSHALYLYAFTSVWFAVTPIMLNVTINMNWIYIRVIPFWIVLIVTEKLAKRYRSI